jgi:hypothetical protein
MGVERPKSFGIRLSDNIEDFKKSIEPLKDIEGVVIYDEPAGYETNQILKKIKTLRYLELHQVFTGIKSVDHLFDTFVKYGQPQREDFEKQLAADFDWELVTTLKPLMDELYLKMDKINLEIIRLKIYFTKPDFVALDRKGKAQKILQYFPDCTGIAFALLDRKEIKPHKLWETFK